MMIIEFFLCVWVENGLLGDFSLINLDDKKKREEFTNQDQVMMGKIERNIELKDELGGGGSKLSFSQAADISSDSLYHHKDDHNKEKMKEDDQKKKDWIIIPHTIILSPNTQVFSFLL